MTELLIIRAASRERIFLSLEPVLQSGHVSSRRTGEEKQTRKLPNTSLEACVLKGHNFALTDNVLG